MSDKLLGGTMLLTAIFVFAYYTTWAILLVSVFTTPVYSTLIIALGSNL